MINQHILIMAVLAATMAMFLWGRWRHDMVAMGALLVCVFTGLVPAGSAFSGFGHPAVITVACVLVLGYGLHLSGAVSILAQRFLPAEAGPIMSIITLIGLAALLSSFMNNVGALALLMPIALQMAPKLNLPAGKILMPLAFGSILGGMTTMIGTPPNIIVSGYRATTETGSFGMFDFAPVGATVAISGILLIGLIGWRLVPTRKQADTGGFVSGDYLSEVRVGKDSKAARTRLRDVEKILEEAGAQVVGMVRRDVRLTAPNPRRMLLEDDILVITVDPESLSTVLESAGLEMAVDPLLDGEKKSEDNEADVQPSKKSDGAEANENKDEEDDETKAPSEEVVLQELVVAPQGALVNRSVSSIELRSRYGINLLAISRQGRRTIKRLRTARIKAGDVLLMQGVPEAISGFAVQFGCLPLAARDIRVPKKGQALTASLIMAAAVGMVTFGLLPAAVSFAAGALAFVALGIVPIRKLYTSIDWSVIVLLGAMLPVADAVATTGAADLIARFLMDSVAQGNAVAVLMVLLVVTMFLSDLMNNAATAAVMCPIAISTAAQLGVNADALLMAIAVGASCAFLTPIGHQNNTLILGPGGFRFGDYWRLGLVLEIIVVAVSVPMILLVWPL